MAGANQDVQRLSQEYEELGEAIQQLQQAKAQVDAQINGCEGAVESLESIDSGEDILVSLGGDTRIRANVEDIEEVLVGVGADVTLELERGEAVEQLEEKIDKLEAQKKDLDAEIQDKEERLQEVAQQAQQAQLGR